MINVSMYRDEIGRAGRDLRGWDNMGDKLMYFPNDDTQITTFVD